MNAWMWGSPWWQISEVFIGALKILRVAPLVRPLFSWMIGPSPNFQRFRDAVASVLLSLMANSYNLYNIMAEKLWNWPPCQEKFLKVAWIGFIRNHPHLWPEPSSRLPTRDQTLRYINACWLLTASLLLYFWKIALIYSYLIESLKNLAKEKMHSLILNNVSIF